MFRNHRAGVGPDPHGQAGSGQGLEACGQFGDRVTDRQTCQHRPPSRVLIRDGVTQADQQLAAGRLHDRPAEPSGGAPDRGQIAAQDLVLLFEAQAVQELGRVEKITLAIQNSHLAALGLAGAAAGRRLLPCGGRGRRRCVGGREQVGGQVASRRVTVVEPLGHRLQADALDVRGDGLVQLPRRLRLVLLRLPQMLSEDCGLERQPAAEHAVQDHAQGVNVGPAIDPVALAGGLLGGHVERRADDVTELGFRRGGVADRQPEVDQHGGSAVFQDDVVRLDIAVDGTASVRVGQGVGYGGDDTGRLLPGGPVVRQPFLQTDAL